MQEFDIFPRSNPTRGRGRGGGTQGQERAVRASEIESFGSSKSFCMHNKVLVGTGNTGMHTKGTRIPTVYNVGPATSTRYLENNLEV